MKYMLLIYVDELALSETEREECYGESTQPAQQLKSNGPFAETREQLGGYFLVDAKDLDEVIGIAARIPVARKGTVEIRPVMAPIHDDELSAEEVAVAALRAAREISNIKVEITMSASTIAYRQIVSRNEWLVERKKHLAHEKELTKQLSYS